MAGEKPDVLLVGNKKPVIMAGLDGKVALHPLIDAKDKDAFLKSLADKVQAIVVSYTNERISPEFMQRFPKLEMCRASASATTTSTPNGRASTASSSPTRRKC